ncbi:MAG: DUF1761 domain-containing protein [Flavobacteriales bacterium]
MAPNLLILLAAALVPMVMGFIWYNPKTLGNAWMKAADVTEEKMKGANMGLIFGLSFLFSFFLAFALNGIVIHQWGLFSLVGGNEEAFNAIMSADVMSEYKDGFRTFGHGVLHGVITGFTIALPIMATNAMFERKGFKYIAINVGYWIITLGLMGGIICQWA